MGHALYRKYRPKNLDEVKGQDHITITLKNAIENNKVAHAYLFTGPRGVGKTSIARIVAHEINKLPYDNESPDIDIIEIDAASNRGVDEIRDLKEKAYIAPTFSKYKVYIIDEVHMLTTFAFNALLKLLEEPPKHVVFILATTDVHKLPETIISRAQRFNFNSVGNNTLIDQLSNIAKQEDINIDKEAIELIAEHGQGSFRDAISMLDQLHSLKNIKAEDVHKVLGIPSEKKVNELIEKIDTPDNLANVSLCLENILNEGARPTSLSNSLHKKLREKMLNGSNSMDYLNLMDQIISINEYNNPSRQLEIIILKFAQSNLKEKNKHDIKHTSTTNKTNSEVQKTNKKSPTQQTKNISDKHDIVYDSKLSEDIFTELLNNLKKKHNTLYSIVRMAEHEFVENELILSFKFSFHQKRISEDANQKILKDIIHKISGKKTKITCLLKQSNDNETTETVEADGIATISNIFGGGELLES